MHGYITEITFGKNEGGQFFIATKLPVPQYSWPEERFFLICDDLTLPVKRHASSFSDNPRRDHSYFHGWRFDDGTEFVYSQWGHDDIPVVLATWGESRELPTVRLDEAAAAAKLDELLLVAVTAPEPAPVVRPTFSWLG